MYKIKQRDVLFVLLTSLGSCNVDKDSSASQPQFVL